MTLTLAAIAPRRRLSIRAGAPPGAAAALAIAFQILASHMIWNKDGSVDETPGKSSLGHFPEHLMFKGTALVNAPSSSTGKRVSVAAESTPNASGTADAPRQVLAVMTGYNSCGPQGDPATGVIESSQVTPLVADYQARYHTPLPHVESCYNGYLSNSIDFRTNVDNAVRSTKWRQDGDVLVEALRGLGRGSARLVLVGHSYGGWTAMRVAARLAAEGLGVDLVTIDPISPVLCAHLDFLRGALATSGSRGCTTGPRDVDDAPLSHKLISWRNFYQTSDPLVHSAPIRGAQNTLIEIPPGTQVRAHDAIPHDDRPWIAVRSLLGLD